LPYSTRRRAHSGRFAGAAAAAAAPGAAAQASAEALSRLATGRHAS
jgi:hypothetical protein